jgi:glutamate dehydrogenase (NAD(P)+)
MSLALAVDGSTQTPTASAPYLEVCWTDPVSGRQGFLVIDRLVRGVCSGGLRLREGCTLEEVRGLAAGMTLKEGLHYRKGNHYVPLGGAKGGIDVSPHDPDARDLLLRYLRGIRPLLEAHWTTGEDLGLRQETLDLALAELGLRSSVQAVYPLLDDESAAVKRLADAFAIEVDGVGLDELVGGLGVAESTLAALDRTGTPRESTRVVVQGFGSMGGATARFLAQAGLVVVGIIDSEGVVANPAGLDVERLLLSRDEFGRVDRTQLRAPDVQLPLDQWLSVETDVLVPAAVSYAITAENQGEVSARLVVEAANMPVLPDAERHLTARGVQVVPDFVANSATNAWWWWTLFGDIEADTEQAFAKVRSEMRRLVEETFDRAEDTGVSLREAALEIADDRLADIDRTFGRG